MFIAAGYAEHVPTHRFSRAGGFPYWTAGCLLHGSLHFNSRGLSVVSRSPQIAIVRPDTPYDVSFAGGRRWSEYFVLFDARPNWHRWLDWPEVLPGFMVLPPLGPADTRRIVRAFKEIYQLYRSAPLDKEQWASNATEKLLLLANTHNPRAAQGRLDERVRAAMQHAIHHSDQPLTVEQLADVAHVSASHLAHLFRDQVGQPPMKFVEAQRLRHAQELLLSTDLPVAAIAQRVGFENPYHFSTRFRKRFGRSPRLYRRQPSQ